MAVPSGLRGAATIPTVIHAAPADTAAGMTHAAGRFATAESSFTTLGTDPNIVTAWLDDIGVASHERVRALSPVQRETLALVAQRNRGWARQLVLHPALTIVSTPLGRITENLRGLIVHGVTDWEQLCRNGGVFHEDPGAVADALAVLDCARAEASTAVRAGVLPRLRVKEDAVPWSLVPEAVRDRLHGSLRPLLPAGSTIYTQLTRRTMIDVLIPGRAVIEVLRLPQGRTAFATPRTITVPERYIAQQLRGYQLLAVAKGANIPAVRIVLYDGDQYDATWARQVEAAARQMGVDFLITHVAAAGDSPRYLFGSVSAPARNDDAADVRPLGHVIPTLRLPKRHRMAVPTVSSRPEGTAPDTQSPEPSPSLADTVTTAVAQGGTAAAWAARVYAIASSADIPPAVKERATQFQTVGADRDLLQWHAFLCGEIESGFGFLDERVGRAETMLAAFTELTAHMAEWPIPVIEQELAHLTEALRRLRMDTQTLEDLWAAMDALAKLVHPDHAAALFGATADHVAEAFANSFIPLTTQLTQLEQQLGEHRQALTERRTASEVESLLADAEALCQATAAEVVDVTTNLRRMAEVHHEHVARWSADTLASASTQTDFFDALPSLLAPVTPVPLPANRRTQLTGLRNRLVQSHEQMDTSHPVYARVTTALTAIDATLERLHAAQEEIAVLQRRHSEQQRRWREQGEHFENRLLVPDAPALPTPIAYAAEPQRHIAGVGTLRFVSSAGRTPNRALIQQVRQQFARASLLVVRDRLFLVDADTARGIRAWRDQRGGPLNGVDLLGQPFALAPHTWGIRTVGIGSVDAEHPVRRLVEIVNRVIERPQRMLADWIAALAKEAQIGNAAEIWQIFLATVTARAPGPEGDLPSALLEFGYAMWLITLQSIALAMYEQMQTHSTLSPQLTRWFEGVDASDQLGPATADIAADTIERVATMTIDELSAVIATTGLLPEEVDDQTAWVAARKKTERTSLAQRKKGAKGPAREAIARQERELDRLSQPYLFARAILEKADRGWLLTSRFRVVESIDKAAVEVAGASWDGLAQARCVVRFVLEHQTILSRWLRRSDLEDDDGHDFFAPERSENEIFAYLQTTPAFAEQDHAALVALGRAYVERELGMRSQPPPIAILLMLGRLIRHREDDLLSRFSREWKQMQDTIRRERPRLEDLAISFELPPQTIVHYMMDFWPDYAALLSFPPLRSQLCDRLLADANVEHG